jgi:hypothetical protein
VGTDPWVTLNAQDVRFGLNLAIANGFPLPLTFVDFSSVNDGGAPGMDIPIGSNKSISLAELDAFEGEEYQRVSVDIKTTAGLVTAMLWEFLITPDEQAQIPCGDWLHYLAENP